MWYHSYEVPKIIHIRYTKSSRQFYVGSKAPLFGGVESWGIYNHPLVCVPIPITVGGAKANLVP